MRKPKRLRFVPSARIKSEYQQAAEAMRMMSNAFQPIVVGITGAIAHLQRAVQIVANAVEAMLADPRFQQELKMQQLYFESWQRNELNDTLTAAGICLPH